MTKNEYMEKLNKALSGFDSEIRDEIVNDYEEHFEIGKAEGKTDDEIAEELGSIEDLVNELNSFAGTDKANGKKSNDSFFNGQDIEKGIDDLLKGFAGFLGSMAATMTKGADKVSGEAGNVAKDIAHNVGTMADKVADKSTTIAGIVAEKSSEFAKEVAESFKTNRGPVSEKEVDEETKEEPAYDPESVSEKYPCPEEVKNIIVETDCGDVIVKPSDDGDFKFDYQNNGTPNQQLAYKFDWSQNGDTIRVACKKQRGVTSFFNSLSCPDITVTILVPDGLEKLDVYTASGDVQVEGIDTETVKINTVSGDSNIAGITNGYVSAVSVSGDIAVVSVRSTAILAKSVSGDVTVEGAAGSLNVGTTSGDVDAKISGAKEIISNAVSGDANLVILGATGFRANIKTVSGDLSLTCNDECCKHIKSGTYTLGDGSVSVNASSVSGCVKVMA